MSTTTDLTDALARALPVIDRHLADQDVPLSQRPTQAAIEFVAKCVEAVREPGQEATAPGPVADFLATPWFAKLYAQVDAWYRDRFGSAFERERDNRLLGAVSIAGTLSALRVPPMRFRPGQPGKTVWISFPDGVREDERPVEWIEAPPNLDRLSHRERK